jgi:CubicO group peptidase (beta-lactamase class C family)
MKQVLGRVAVVSIFAFLLCQAQTADKPSKPQTPSERMDEVFEFWNRLDQPGYAALVVKDGQVLYQKAFGLACLENPAPNTPKTVFHLAQASQPFTGMAVAILEKQGKLSLDDDVRKHLPEIPDFGTPLKVGHLLNQASGLRDWLSLRTLAGRENEDINVAAILDYAKSQKSLLFPPGSRSQYSGTNYDLLAEIVKRVAGKPFPEWAWENMFKPLKMTRTHFRENSREVIENQAFSYNFNRTESYLKGLDNLNASGSYSLFSNLEEPFDRRGGREGRRRETRFARPARR